MTLSSRSDTPPECPSCGAHYCACIVSGFVGTLATREQIRSAFLEGPERGPTQRDTERGEELARERGWN